jgi:hypothetical protein
MSLTQKEKAVVICIQKTNKQKKTCSLLQRGTLSLSSKVVHYTNILARQSGTKAQCLRSQDRQKPDRLMNTVSYLRSNTLQQSVHFMTGNAPKL